MTSIRDLEKADADWFVNAASLSWIHQGCQSALVPQASLIQGLELGSSVVLERVILFCQNVIHQWQETGQEGNTHVFNSLVLSPPPPPPPPPPRKKKKASWPGTVQLLAEIIFANYSSLICVLKVISYTC